MPVITTATEASLAVIPASISRGKRVMPLIEKLGHLEEKEVNFLKGLPTMIMQNGLGQTVAYMMNPKKNLGEFVRILTLLLRPEPENAPVGKTDLIRTIMNSPVENYIYLQNEAIEYAGWMKKFAVAFYEKPVSEEGGS